MKNLYASKNSRFFAARLAGELRIFRSDHPAFFHRVNDRVAGRLVAIGNNGDAFFRNGQNFYRLRGEKGVKAERPRCLAHVDGSEEGGQLGGLVVHADGRDICYEQILDDQGPRFKLPWGSKKKGGEKSKLHRLVVSNIANPRKQTAFYETVVDPSKGSKLKWAVSPTFGFMVVAQTTPKKQTEFSLVDILDESVVSEFVINLPSVEGLQVTDNGTVLIEAQGKSGGSAVIWTYSQERHVLTAPENSRVYHFATNRVVFLSKDGRHLEAKNFEDVTLVQVDLAPLAEFELEYLLHFTSADDIQLVTFDGRHLKIHHTDLQTLPIDAKRWRNIQEERRLLEEEQRIESIVAEHERDEARLRALEKSRELEGAIMAPVTSDLKVRSTPTPPPEEPPPVEEMPKRLGFTQAKPPSRGVELPEMLTLDLNDPTVGRKPGDRPQPSPPPPSVTQDLPSEAAPATRAFEVPQTEPELEAGALTQAFDVPHTEDETESPAVTRVFEVPQTEPELEAGALTQAYDVPHTEDEPEAPAVTRAFDVPQTEPELEVGALTQAFDVPNTEDETESTAVTRVFEVPETEEEVELEAPVSGRSFVEEAPIEEDLDLELELELELDGPALTRAFPKAPRRPIPPPPSPDAAPTFLDLPSDEAPSEGEAGPEGALVSEELEPEPEAPPPAPPPQRPAMTTVVEEPSSSLENFPAVSPRFTRAFGSLDDLEATAPAPQVSKESALETLRMQYIAGEMSREQYYERKQALEDSSESDLTAPPSIDTGMRKKRPLAKGRRIELNLDKD